MEAQSGGVPDRLRPQLHHHPPRRPVRRAGARVLVVVPRSLSALAPSALLNELPVTLSDSMLLRLAWRLKEGCRTIAQGGERELVLGVDDELLRKAEKEGTSRRIPRDDVAALAIAALTSPSADNRCVCSLFCNPGWPPLFPGMCSDALAVAALTAPSTDNRRARCRSRKPAWHPMHPGIEGAPTDDIDALAALPHSWRSRLRITRKGILRVDAGIQVGGRDRQGARGRHADDRLRGTLCRPQRQLQVLRSSDTA